jgi:predicted DCC family thiol-disulfide oxidoreductase YuxK
MKRPLLVYDGGCKFCVSQVAHLRGLLGECFEMVSFREPQFFAQHPQLTLTECEKAIQLMMPSGQVFSGAEAVAQLMGHAPWLALFKWVYYVPGLRMLWDWLYANVSMHRYKLSYWTWRR